MKALVTFLALALLAAGPVGCGKKSDDDKDKDKDTGPIETTVDYVIGKTPIEAGARAKRTTIQVSIKNAVYMFEIENERSPISLKEVVGAGYLDKRYLNDEYGRPLEVEVKEGTFVVRSVRLDSKTGKRVVRWEKKF